MPASGATLTAVFADLEANYPGIADRLVDEAGLRRFVNVYLNDEDVRFLGGLDTELTTATKSPSCPRWPVELRRSVAPADD